MNTEFNGHSKLYRKVSILMSLYTCISIYLLFSLTLYFFEGKVWMFSAEMLAGVVVFTAAYAVFHKWLMDRLDKPKDKAWNWEGVSTEVKLPETIQHQRFG
ncbi:hypothetical protein R50073_12950 [Maricurvus nonylphenolicus]|uniref:hypothetical protein n=1 Tax=Maricurvus nonylphenolicus TaxID=1008307 RepID=UPI0036F40E49